MSTNSKLVKVLTSDEIGLFVDESLPFDRVTGQHEHFEFELVYINQGIVNFLVGDHQGSLSEGDVVLIGPRLTHRFSCQPDSRMTSMYFDKNAILSLVHAITDLSKLDGLLEQARQGIQFFPSDQQVGELVFSLRDTYGVDRVIGLFQLFKNLLLDKEHRILASENPSACKNDVYVQDRIREVNTFMRNNLQNKITLEDLAEKANMSPQAFSSFYKKRTGKTVFQKLNEMRIDYAKKLILEDRLNVSEIANACGYPSMSFFNRQFKKFTRVTPSYFRKSILEMAA